MNILKIGNIVSTDYGAYVFPMNIYDAPVREIRPISASGKSGDILFDNKRYPNVRIGYTFVIMKDFKVQYRKLRQELLSLIGYTKLEWNNDLEYRMGYLSETVEPVMASDGKSGKFQVVFSCRPQIYLREGDDQLEYDDNCEIVNPTLFDSKPLIRVYGYGNLTINNSTIRITQHEQEYIDIDLEIMDAYCEDVNMNGFISIVGEIPYFWSGKNDINLGSNISKIVVTPRWYYI